MAGGDDDYGEAFKKAKLEHDQQLEAPTEAKRLQAEADADIAVLSNVVLPQLQAAAQKLHPLGGKVEIQMALPRGHCGSAQKGPENLNNYAVLPDLLIPLAYTTYKRPAPPSAALDQ